MEQRRSDGERQGAASELGAYREGRIVLGRAGSRGRREYEVLIMRPGRVVRADGQPSNWLIPAEAIRSAVPLFEGVASYLDHPETVGPAEVPAQRGEPQVKNLVGVIFDPRWDEDEQALLAGLRLYDGEPHSPGALAGALLDQMLRDREQGLKVPEIGLSAVFYHASSFDQEAGLRVTRAFKKVESVDLVYAPGAGGYVRGALAALSAAAREGGCSPDGERIQGSSAQERSCRMPEERTEERQASGPPEGAQDNSSRSGLEGALTAIREVSEQVVVLTSQVAEMEAERTIQGLGRAPREPARARLGPTGLEQMQTAMDWVFGVESASPPPPDLRRTDRLYYLLTGDGNWTGVFNERDALAAANPTTLPGMAVNAMNKVIVPLYERLLAYRWFEPIVAVQPTNGSLHDMAWIQFGGIGNLPVVADGAAYTELSVADSKESDSFTKYGGYVGITEKMLRNSDIAKIQAVPRALTIAAVQTRSARIASLFTSNSGAGPTLGQDSTALFHADHGNLATTAFSWDAWKAARLECYKQTELGSGKRQGLWPKFWLGPADLYDEALIVFGFGAGTGGKPGEGSSTAFQDVNPFAESRVGDPRPIPIAVPDFGDTNDWAYIADPQIAPVIQMAYADNPGGRSHPAPRLYSVTSPTAGLMFSNDVLPIKVRDTFAYGVATYRGIGKRNVA